MIIKCAFVECGWKPPESQTLVVLQNTFAK